MDLPHASSVTEGKLLNVSEFQQSCPLARAGGDGSDNNMIFQSVRKVGT